MKSKQKYLLIGALALVIIGISFAKIYLQQSEEDIISIEECVSYGEEISPKEYSQGVRCCSGLARIQTSTYFYPCYTPGEFACDSNGCSIPPPTSDETSWWQCSPCDNGICESEYGENVCNCPEDCK